MKIAIVGSRNIKEADIASYACAGDEIVSGGAVGVDCCAADFAIKNGLKLTEFLPEYKIYGRAAPMVKPHISYSASSQNRSPFLMIFYHTVKLWSIGGCFSV